MNYTKYLNLNSTNWTMNVMGQQIITWAQDQGGIFLSYADFYQTYFSYGLASASDPHTPIIPIKNINGSGYPENLVLATLASEIFISTDNTSAIAILTYDNTYDQQTKNNFIDDLDAKCGDIAKEYGADTIKLSMTGETALIKAMNEESRKDVERKDTLTIPLALCVLALIIRSWRLMFIPLLTFGVSICCAFSLMRPVKIYTLSQNRKKIQYIYISIYDTHSLLNMCWM